MAPTPLRPGCLVRTAGGNVPTGEAMGAALARDRSSLITGGVLVVVALAAWAAVVLQAEMPSPVPGGTQAMAFLIAWGIMMAAMMLPSATPMIALYAAVRRNAASGGWSGISTVLFGFVYLALWVAFGVPVYVAGVIIGAQTVPADLLRYALALVLVRSE